MPFNIIDHFNPVVLAFWIMDDAYFNNNTLFFCTDSYTKADCLLLVDALAKWGIKSSLNVRYKNKGNYRIRVSVTSMPLLRDLVLPYLHPTLLYKLVK